MITKLASIFKMLSCTLIQEVNRNRFRILVIFLVLLLISTNISRAEISSSTSTGAEGPTPFLTYNDTDCQDSAVNLVDGDKFLYGKFPPNFKWGLGTASYQVEGAWNVSGKGPSIWDTFTHQIPSPINFNGTGDVTCDSYNKYSLDVAALKSIGAQQYRFSISWPRILPLGTLRLINQPGLDYYNKLINELIAAGIEPIVTIFHWDLPQPLQDQPGGGDGGGWANQNEFIIEHYLNYAKLLFSQYGGRVKTWITFGSPWVICWLGYNGVYAPGIIDPAEKPYQCGHTILKAHALAYRMYQAEFGQEQGGQIGIAFDVKWYEPATSQIEDVEAAERVLQFKFGWFGSPLIYGKYPDVMREFIDKKSEEEGRNSSRLPILEPEWANIIQGSWDFIGLNHYTTDLVRNHNYDTNDTIITPGWQTDQNTYTFQNSSWPSTGSFWLKVVPWGFRKLLNWIRTEYNNPRLIITENGMSDAPQDGENPLLDVTRIYYYQCYLNNLLKATSCRSPDWALESSKLAGALLLIMVATSRGTMFTGNSRYGQGH